MPDVILPVLNEATAIPWVLSRMPEGYRPIVVDNGSDDGSGEIAAALGADVVLEGRRGFGAACFAGLERAADRMVCFMDCDASLDPAALPSVVAPILRGEADLVLGRRRALPGSWPMHARLANRALALEIRRRTGVGLADLGPMRAAPREFVIGLDLRDRGFGWPLEMVLAAARKGGRIAEVPVTYLPRTGRSKVTGSLTGILRTVRDMRAVLR